jgi:hypothetical protein
MQKRNHNVYLQIDGVDEINLLKNTLKQFTDIGIIDTFSCQRVKTNLTNYRNFPFYVMVSPTLYFSVSVLREELAQKIKKDTPMHYLHSIPELQALVYNEKVFQVGNCFLNSLNNQTVIVDIVGKNLTLKTHTTTWKTDKQTIINYLKSKTYSMSESCDLSNRLLKEFQEGQKIAYFMYLNGTYRASKENPCVNMIEPRLSAMRDDPNSLILKDTEVMGSYVNRHLLLKLR